MRQGLLRGIGANAFAQIANLAVQLVSVPIYLLRWHLGIYGVWVVLFTLPGYIVLLDLGFATTAANDMLLAAVGGNRAGALRTFRSLWIGVCLVCAIGISVAILSALALPAYLLPSAATVDPAAVRATIALLSLYAFTSLQGSVMLAGLRCAGLYPLGVNIMTITALTEAGLSLLFVMLGGGIEGVAAILAIVRACSVVTEYLILRRRVPWLSLSFSGASSEEFWRLAPKALAGIAIPIGFAITLQGMVLAVALVSSAIAAATYATVRTLSRVSFQFAAAISNAVMPEYTVAVGRGDRASALRLFVINFLVALGILLPAVIVLAILGPFIVQVWTGGSMHPPRLLIAGLAFAMCLHGLWHFVGNLLLSINRHQGYAYYYPVVASLGVALAAVTVKQFGLSAIVLPCIFLEAAMLAIVWREYLAVTPFDWQMVKTTSLSLRGTIPAIFGKGRKVEP